MGCWWLPCDPAADPGKALVKEEPDREEGLWQPGLPATQYLEGPDGSLGQRESDTEGEREWPAVEYPDEMEGPEWPAAEYLEEMEGPEWPAAEYPDEMEGLEWPAAEYLDEMEGPELPAAEYLEEMEGLE
ncbi:unnamed protein product [Caretta caretta]